MSFDNTKYHLELNNVPIIVKGYVRNEAPTFVPRLSQGALSESDFSLVSSRSILSFAGGMLQRYWEDDNAYFGSENLYPVYGDGVLYPVNNSVESTGLIGKSKMYAPAYSVAGYCFYSYQTYSAPTNVVKRINPDGTTSTLTLPLSLSSSARTITSIIYWNGYIWFGVSSGSKMYYHDLTTTTVNEVAAGTSGSLRLLQVLNGNLYGTGSNNSAISKYTGDTATQSFTVVYDTNMKFESYNASFVNFNGRLMLLRLDGMFSYDGVSGSTIETQNTDDRNYRHAAVVRGYLHYFMPDGMYRFSGALIEKLYDAAEIGFPVNVCVGKNRIWFAYSNSENGSSRYDKSMGYDYSSGDDIDGRVAVYDGKGLFTYTRISTFVKNPMTIDFTGQDELTDIFWHANKLYMCLNYSKAGTYHYCDTNEIIATGNKSWRLVTSIYGKDFAMINKNIENLELVFDGDNSTDQDITLEYRTSGFDGSDGWVSLGSFKTVTKAKEQVWRVIPAGLSARLIQFRLSGTTDATRGIAKLIMRYTLNPEFKWQWQFAVVAMGDDPLRPLKLADGVSNDSQSIDELRNAIYAARSSQTPIKFIDSDRLFLNGDINNSVTTITLNTTRLIKGSSGFIQIDDEIMYWTAKTSTQLTVERAVLNTVAASHTNNSKVFIVYRVIVDKILSERIEFKNRQSQSEDQSLATELAVSLREV